MEGKRMGTESIKNLLGEHGNKDGDPKVAGEIIFLKKRRENLENQRQQLFESIADYNGDDRVAFGNEIIVKIEKLNEELMIIGEKINKILLDAVKEELENND